MGTDYLLRDGFIIDGSGANSEPDEADIAIEGDSIKDTGDLSHINAERTISIKGLCACPGFIDVHSHSDFTLLADGRAEGKICQGITTEINGNCGMSAAPLYGAALEQRAKDLDELNITERWNSFAEYFSLLEKREIAVNFLTLTGHGNLRASVVGYADKPLSKNDTAKIIELLQDAAKAGSKGLSTGLIYPPGIFSDTSEIVEIARAAAKYNGIYTTHMRSEGDRLIESVDEAIRISDEAGIHVHISHLKTSGENNWNKLAEVFDKIESANARELSLTCDRYPYIASSTDLDAILPAWAFEGGFAKEIVKLKTEQDKLKEDILREHPDNSCWDKIVISSVYSDKNKWMEGKSIAEISGSSGCTPLDSVFKVLIEEELRVGAIFYFMNEDNMKSILQRPYAMIGTDSSARSFDGITAKGLPHPRGFGSFPRILGRYVRDESIMTLGNAIYKMTGLPAKTFRINRRGLIARNYYADIVVFDPGKIRDISDFNDPFQRPEGIHYVFVNGTPVIFEGKVTGALPGRILR